MAATKRSHLFGFGTGVILAIGFPFAAHRFPILHAALFYAVCIGTILCLPLIFASLRREAVPAKSSDLIGYAAILVFVLAIGGVAYVVLK
jgi:hypothetical protein